MDRLNHLIPKLIRSAEPGPSAVRSMHPVLRSVWLISTVVAICALTSSPISNALGHGDREVLLNSSSARSALAASVTTGELANIERTLAAIGRELEEGTRQLEVSERIDVRIELAKLEFEAAVSKQRAAFLAEADRLNEQLRSSVERLALALLADQSHELRSSEKWLDVALQADQSHEFRSSAKRLDVALQVDRRLRSRVERLTLAARADRLDEQLQSNVEWLKLVLQPDQLREQRRSKAPLARLVSRKKASPSPIMLVGHFATDAERVSRVHEQLRIGSHEATAAQAYADIHTPALWEAAETEVRTMSRRHNGNDAKCDWRFFSEETERKVIHVSLNGDSSDGWRRPDHMDDPPSPFNGAPPPFIRATEGGAVLAAPLGSGDDFKRRLALFGFGPLNLKPFPTPK